MKLKRGFVVATLALVLALSGTGAVYQFYVKERMSEYAAHLEEETVLEERIERLQKTFYGTKPETVLATWRGETQPWVEAVRVRSKFFNLGDYTLREEVPPEKIPRFYYKDEYPKRFQKIEQEAWSHNIVLDGVDFGVPTPDGIKGTNPSAEQVSEWLTRFKYVASVTRFLIEANATTIDEVNIWEPRMKGNIEMRSAGLRFQMPMKELVTFLDALRMENRFFSVDALWVSNQQLRNPLPLLQVEMVLSQALYKEGDMKGGGPGGVRLAGGLDLKNAFSGGPQGFDFFSAQKSRDTGRSWWQNFRRKYLPF